MEPQAIPIVHRGDIPPCRHCGGQARWLNAGLLDLGPWHWHCARCSPAPSGQIPDADLADPEADVTL